jgi:hypothetical protein
LLHRAAGAGNAMMEYMHETVARLRKQFGREPTAEEIKAERDGSIRREYADMALSATTLENEARWLLCWRLS